MLIPNNFLISDLPITRSPDLVFSVSPRLRGGFIV
jgi:hypothetical protein